VGKPTLKRILDALKNQVLLGRSYLNLAKGLLKADPVILQTGPTFFGLTTPSSSGGLALLLRRGFSRGGLRMLTLMK
jgi:hypothetical protein